MKYDKSISQLFWRWFAQEQSRIREAHGRGDVGWLDSVVTPRVQDIHERLNWELGPYNAPDDTFVLSPTIRENLPLTWAVVDEAPELEGWHFLHAKPAKNLSSLRFTARDCTVDADNWRYLLTSYNDGEFVDIEILVNSADDLPVAHDSFFCELAVEALVGEERRLEQVGSLTPVVVEDNTAIERSTSMRFLNAHLDEVLSPLRCVSGYHPGSEGD